MRYIRISVFTALAVLSVAACSRNRPGDDTAMGQPSDTTSDTTAVSRPGDETAVRTDTTRVQTDTTSGMRTDTTAADAAGDPAQIAMGDSIFNSKVGGKNCQSCHGVDAKGSNMAPDLTDDEWLHGDGSLEFIKQTIRNGVSNPKKHNSSMPPFQNVLTDEQINAVAAYVRSRSQQQRVG